uniref:Alpha 1,4-glycosyltransferase domain-containing protein n=1 Tax=Haptolina brevifila TaxID=156173 RepID=A0A7S2DQZ1_9EUKA|mmetsp:Transcript_4253/g.9348  ORF Transcript_4253/g.9348 Transcript_4253/m.9348 type:complete len:370 (+) Transcript_4253:53-1162(+)
MPPPPRRVARRAAARTQACACLGCFAFLCQAFAFVNFYYRSSPTTSATAVPLPTARPSPPPPPPSPVPKTSKISAAEPHDAKPLSSSVIPRLVHQSWRDGGFPKDLFNWRWQKGLLDLNPGWQLMTWTDASSRELIAKEYPWFLPTYDAYPAYIQRCDAARYFILHHHGGVYADLDIECSKPFAPVLEGHRAVFSYKQGTNMSRGLVNALFASEPRHPLWSTVFNLLKARGAAGASASTHVDVVRSTGPGLLREAVLELQSKGQLDAMGVHLLESSVWHPIMPEQKRGRDLSALTAAAIAASHCYHHFVSSWMTHDKERHQSTDKQRGASLSAGGSAASGSHRTSQNGTTVPLGQGTFVSARSNRSPLL